MNVIEYTKRYLYSDFIVVVIYHNDDIALDSLAPKVFLFNQKCITFYHLLRIFCFILIKYPENNEKDGQP